MPLAIRPARPADLDTLVAIEQGAFAGDRLSRRSLRTLTSSPTAAVLVAERSGEVAGYALVLFRHGTRTARLYSLAAAPGQRGVGAPLLAACEAAAMARGATAMHLEVRADNLRAVDLYRRSGYEQRDEVPSYYEDGEAALRFGKVLTATAAPPGPPGRPADACVQRF